MEDKIKSQLKELLEQQQLSKEETADKIMKLLYEEEVQQKEKPKQSAYLNSVDPFFLFVSLSKKNFYKIFINKDSFKIVINNDIERDWLCGYLGASIFQAKGKVFTLDKKEIENICKYEFNYLKVSYKVLDDWQDVFDIIFNKQKNNGFNKIIEYNNKELINYFNFTKNLTIK